MFTFFIKTLGKIHESSEYRDANSKKMMRYILWKKALLY